MSKVIIDDTSHGAADENSRVIIDVPADPGIVITAPGPQGPAGGSAFAYVHEQLTPSASWVIHHGLNGYPNVTVADSSGNQVEGDVDYINGDTIALSFSLPFSGTAYLS